MKDLKGLMWFATKEGLNKYDGYKFTVHKDDRENAESISNNSIRDLMEDAADNLWVITESGLDRFDRMKETFVLAGDKGLDLFDRDTPRFFHHQHDPKNKHSLSNDIVNSIMEVAKGNLWLGTAGGLNYFDLKSKTFSSYTEKDGLSNDMVLSTQQDKNGNLWISTNYGLSKFNPSTKVFRNYAINDGLQSNTFEAKASYQAPDGEMFFGGLNGFNSFYPDSIKENDFVPPVYITDFLVFNKHIDIGDGSPLKHSINEIKEITLSCKQSVFTIEFAALNFTQPGQNMYAYKLEGFDRNGILLAINVQPLIPILMPVNMFFG